jgi:hypothetical protein
MEYKTVLVSGLLIMCMTLLSSCKADGEQILQEPVKQKSFTPVKPTVTAEPAGTKSATVQKRTPTAGQPTQKATAQATSQSTPTHKNDLQATDPDVVQIASGEIQLVEFFAYW